MSGSIPFGKVVNIAGYEVEVLERSGKYLVYFYEENGCCMSFVIKVFEGKEEGGEE